MDWITIASIIRVKSRKEGFVLRCKTGLSAYLAPGMVVTFIPPQLDCPRSATVKTVAPGEVDEVTVTFTEEFSAEMAGKLVGLKVIADAALFPVGADGDSLMGLSVIDERFGALGVVTEVIEGPAQRLLVVTPDVDGEDGEPVDGGVVLPEEILIPFVEELVRVDVGAGILRSAIPAGLLSLGA